MAGLGASVSVQLVTDFSETEHNTLNKTFRIKSKVNSLSSFSRRMTGLYSQTKILWSADVDWWHKDTKWPQSGQATRGNLLTLTRCHPTVLCGIFPWLAKGIILFWVKFKSFICLIGNSELVFVHICPFPNKNSLVTLVFLRWSFNLSLNSERSNLQKLLCATVLINFAIFLEKKNKSKFPVRSKVRRNGQAGTGLER